MGVKVLEKSGEKIKIEVKEHVLLFFKGTEKIFAVVAQESAGNGRD